MINQVLIDILVAVIIAVIGVLTKYGTAFINTTISKIEDERIRTVAEDAISYVEAKCASYSSEEKFDKACEITEACAEKLNLNIDEKVIKSVIQGVFNSNDGILVNTAKVAEKTSEDITEVSE